jgi:hypothetical protein
MKNNLPLSSTTLINRFEGSCGTFGEGKQKCTIIDDIYSICSKIIIIK